jgi:hypothetical protein
LGGNAPVEALASQ